jgi:mono/diheme cytochrome c family protein
MRRITGTLMLLAAALAGLPAAGHAQNGAEGVTVLQGVYAKAQAESGKTTFLTICVSCHASSQFRGPGFFANWGNRTAYDLFELLRTTMPNDNPGALSRKEYAAVIAYMFDLNGFPPGKSALPADDAALKKVRIVEPESGSR